MKFREGSIYANLTATLKVDKLFSIDPQLRKDEEKAVVTRR